MPTLPIDSKFNAKTPKPKNNDFIKSRTINELKTDNKKSKLTGEIFKVKSANFKFVEANNMAKNKINIKNMSPI